VAIDVVVEGARIIRAASGQLGDIETKSSPTDTVTTLDLDVERAMRAALAKRTPGASIIGEEHEAHTGETRVGWVIDPIDGTVNLTYDLPVIGVSLAATIDGEVVAGAVFDVVRDEVFSAAAGTGARRDGSAIRASAVSSFANALVATGFAYTSDSRESEADCFRRVLPEARDIRCFGSTALHLCWVACGRIDASYQRNVKL
jgi:myo-inositol-1(or 4)-monophosphatase